MTDVGLSTSVQAREVFAVKPGDLLKRPAFALNTSPYPPPLLFAPGLRCSFVVHDTTVPGMYCTAEDIFCQIETFLLLD